MAKTFKDPKHLSQAYHAAIEKGIDPDIVSKVLGLASHFRRERDSRPHKVMTPDRLASHQVLYKYRDTANERHVDILRKQELWLADPVLFNDPFDSNLLVRFDLKPAAERTAWITKMVKADHPKAGPKLIEKFVREAEEALLDPNTHDAASRKWVRNLISKMKVFCLCPEKDNILLWSHYSCNHTGFAIGFDPLKLEDLIKTNRGFMTGYVSYRDSYPILQMPLDGSEQIDKEDLVATLLNVKSRRWAYEKEIRMTTFEGPSCIPFGPDLIKEIILGCRSSEYPVNEGKLLKVVEEQYPNTAVYRAKMSREAFTLEFDRIM